MNELFNGIMMEIMIITIDATAALVFAFNFFTTKSEILSLGVSEFFIQAFFCTSNCPFKQYKWGTSLYLPSLCASNENRIEQIKTMAMQTFKSRSSN